MVMQQQHSSNKKIKPFYDAKEKPKHRYAALVAFLDTLEPSQHVAFLKEHFEMLIDFLLTSFQQISDRMKTDEEYRKRFHGEKAFGKHFFPLPLLTLLVKQLTGELGRSERLSQVVNVLRTLLVPGNERYVRAAGMNVLLSWLSARQYPPVLLTLFSSAVDLKDLGITNQSNQVLQESFPVHHGEQALFPCLNNSNSALELLEDTLKLITFEPEPDQHSVKVWFEVLRTSYLEKIYQQPPSPQVQELIIKFAARWTCHQEFVPMDKTSKVPSSSAVLLLGELVESEATAINIVHKIIAAGLKLPYSQHGSIKACLGILRSFLFQLVDRQPVFVREAANEYAQRYCQLLSLLFDRRPFIGFQREQVDTYQDALYFLRALGMQSYFSMNTDTWEGVLGVLLEIGSFLFGPGSMDLIVTPALTTELGHLYGETLWVALQRSDSKKRLTWEAVANTMQSIQNPSIFQEWSKVVHHLTDILLQEHQQQEKQHQIALSPTAMGGSSFATSWIGEQSVQESIVFLWKNSLRAVGDLFARPQEEIREEIALTYARITDKLLKASTQGLPIYELARVLLRVAYEGGTSSSRKAALSMVCRLFCLPHSLQSEQANLGMFLTVLKKALMESDDESLQSVLLENTSDLYSQEHLSASHLEALVPLYLEVIERLLMRNSPLLVSKLWDVCRLLGDIYISTSDQTGERIIGILQRLYSWSKQDVNLEGPVICLVSNLLIQHDGEEERLLNVLLEAIMPKADGILCPYAIQAIQSLTFLPNFTSPSFSSKRKLLIQRVLLAIRSCLLPVAGGDNRPQDVIGSRLLSLLHHYPVQEDFCDDVWLLLDDCEHAHVVPGMKETEMGRAAKYLKLHLLYGPNGKCSKETDFDGAMYALKVGTVLSLNGENKLQSRNVSGVNNMRIHPGKPKKPFDKLEPIIIHSAQVLPEVDAYYAESDFEDTLLQDLLSNSDGVAVNGFEVDDGLIRDVMEQVQKLYLAECEHAAKYRAMIKQQVTFKNTQVSKVELAEVVGEVDYLTKLLTNLELLGLAGFEYHLVRDANKEIVKLTDQVAPKQVIKVAAPNDVLIEDDAFLLQLSTNVEMIGINAPGKNVQITVRPRSIQIEYNEKENVVVAPLGYGTKVVDFSKIYQFLLPTLIHLNSSLVHPYSGRLMELGKVHCPMKETLSAFLNSTSIKSEEWRMKAAAIDGMTATSPTNLPAPRYLQDLPNSTLNSTTEDDSMIEEMQIY